MIQSVIFNSAAFEIRFGSRQIHLFFHKQFIFDPCPVDCLSFSKKSPQKIV